MDMEDMDTEVMVVMDMGVDTMARERLKLMLSPAIFPEDMDMEDMDTEVMVATDMDAVTMARGRLMLNQDILEDMVVMAVVTDMEAMDMVDMAVVTDMEARA